MGYRNIFLLNPARLSVKNEQLIVETVEKRSVPLEDIECIAIDNLQTDISAYTLMKIAEYGITMYISNSLHHPVSVLLPTNQHTRHLQVLNAQLAFSKPELKRLWQQIIVRKIENQATVLKLLNRPESIKLDQMKLKVKSGDSDNIEAVAAAFYFKALFDTGFTRNSDSIINAFLNYGYAIIRSTIEKYLCVYGFEPALGIFHHSVQNNFNLADDLIEVYRPIVDLYTAKNASEDLAEFSANDRAALLNLLNVDICLDNKEYSVAYAIERTVQSLSGIINGNRKDLLLPKLITLAQHEYE